MARGLSTLLALLLSVPAHGQSQSAVPGAQTPAPPATAATHEQAPTWEFSASVYTYLLPDEGNYAQPTLTADRDWLHLEARYNYEGLRAGSVWLGYNLGGGEALVWEFTPMLGGVFGDTAGVAPGYKGSLGWRWLELYSEGEYVFDADESSESFFFNWSELAVAPADWIRMGLVTQRTRVYKSERDIQRGLLLGLSYKNLDGTVFVLNPDDSRPTVVIAIALGF